MNWQVVTQQTHPQTATEIVDTIMSGRNLAGLKPQKTDLASLCHFLQIDKKALDQALELINDCLKSNRPVIVFGDYDVDGICATSILWQTLHNIGLNSLPFIPDRQHHGYGLSSAALDLALSMFPNQKPLIITVDCGATSFNVVSQYQRLGVDFVITDHHQLPDIPPPAPLIHSTLTCGATLAFILAQSLSPDCLGMDLVALATICDQIPLLEMNRSLVISGLDQIRQSPRLGLKLLFNQSGLTDIHKLDASYLGFTCGPQINSVGRLGNALDAVRLLCTSSIPKARSICRLLLDLNQKRRDLTQLGVSLAEKKFSALSDLPPVLFFADSDLHEGVIGLVAARLMEKYQRPAIVVSKQSNFSKGSARVPTGLNITQILKNFPQIKEIGGHASAAGFTIDTKTLRSFASALMTSSSFSDFESSVVSESVDLLLHPEQDLKVIHDALYRLAPFGQGFPEPKLAYQNIRVISSRLVGRSRDHLQLTLALNNLTIDAIQFSSPHQPTSLSGLVSLSFYLRENTFNSKTKLQLQISTIWPH